MTNMGWLKDRVEGTMVKWMPGVVQLLGSQASITGGGFSYHAQDGELETLQMTCTPQLEEQLCALAKRKAVIRVETSSLLKGFKIRVEEIEVLKPDMEGKLLGAGKDALTEIPMQWYEDCLVRKGLMQGRRFIREHTDYISNSPARPQRNKKRNHSADCAQCGRHYKTARGLKGHMEKEH